MTIPRPQRSRPHLASVLFVVGLVAAIVAGIPAAGGSSSSAATTVTVTAVR